MKTIIETQVWCYGKSQEEVDREQTLGITIDAPDDVWLPFAVDFDKVIAIKQAAETEFLGPNRATVYINEERLTINLSFEEAVEIWKKS